jgi:MraZ protein
MFRGRFEHTVDGKGRVALPQSARLVVEGFDASGLLAMTRHPLQACALVMPMKVWTEDFEPKLMQISIADPVLDDVQLVLSSSFSEVELDKQGRLVVPQFLRRELGLDGEVCWIGSGRHMQLWSKAALDARVAEANTRIKSPEGRAQLPIAMGAIKL